MCFRSTWERARTKTLHSSTDSGRFEPLCIRFGFCFSFFPFVRFRLIAALFWWCLVLFLAQIYRLHTRNALSYCQFDSKTLNSPFAHTRARARSHTNRTINQMGKCVYYVIYYYYYFFSGNLNLGADA